MFQLLCAVFIGGGTGSVLRWWLGMKLNPVHHAIPIGTLTANLLGAFVIGAGLAWFNRLTGIDPMWKLLITTGFCGGLTTFSTFSAEVVFARCKPMANKPTPEELKNGLSEMQFYVTQHHGTEPPFTGRLLHNKKNGVYHCLVCDAPLFNSQTKYDSGCGWPSFYEPVSAEAIRYLTDNSHGMQRIEIRCGNCDAHLGHVFPDGPQPTGERYCVNSASLSFTDEQNGEQIKG